MRGRSRGQKPKKRVGRAGKKYKTRRKKMAGC